MRRALSGGCIAAGVALTAAVAHAHEPAHGRALAWMDDSQEAPAVIVSNRGLVFAEVTDSADVEFSMRCNESYAVPTSERPSIQLNSSGSLLLGLYHGVYRSSDGACSIERASGLPDVSLSPFALIGDRLLASTRTLEEPAAVWSSDDGGEHWEQAYANREGEYFDVLLPAGRDTSRLYAYAVAGAERLCGRSTDGGHSWETHPLPPGARPFAVHPSRPEVVFAYAPQSNTNEHHTILRSADGCESFDAVLHNVGKPSDLVELPDTGQLWLGVRAEGGLYVSDDQGESFVRRLEEDVRSVDCLEHRDGRVWLCATRSVGNGIWYTDDAGQSLHEFMTFHDVARPVVCEDAAARSVCAGPWYDFTSELPAPVEEQEWAEPTTHSDAATANPGAPDGCKVSPQPSPPADWIVILVALRVHRARRRSAAPA